VKHNTITFSISFLEWLAARIKRTEFEIFSATEQDELLRGFYGEVSIANGQFNAKSSNIGIYSSLTCSLKDAPHNKIFDIKKYQAFKSSRHVFLGCLRKYKVREQVDYSMRQITDKHWDKL